MHDRTDARQEDAGQDGCRTDQMQDIMDAGQVRCRTDQDRTDVGECGWRTGWLQDRRKQDRMDAG